MAVAVCVVSLVVALVEAVAIVSLIGLCALVKRKGEEYNQALDDVEAKVASEFFDERIVDAVCSSVEELRKEKVHGA